jgi:hypothetical protein
MIFEMGGTITRALVTDALNSQHGKCFLRAIEASDTGTGWRSGALGAWQKEKLGAKNRDPTEAKLTDGVSAYR